MVNSFLFQEKSNAEENVAKTKDTTEPPSTTTDEVVDLSKEEVNIVTLHFKNLKFDFKYLLGSWSSLNSVFLS